MIFQELLFIINLDTLKKVLTQWHVNEDEQILYFDFIERLKAKTAIKSDSTLLIDKRIDEDIEQFDVGVEEDSKTYAIDFVPWEEVLGYQVNINENETTKEEFAFHVLYDMSFDGFFEDVREESLNRIVSRIDNLEEIDDSDWIEHNPNSPTIEEVKKKFYSDNTNEEN